MRCETSQNRVIGLLLLTVGVLSGALAVQLIPGRTEKLAPVYAAPAGSAGFREFQDTFRRVAAENLPVVVEIDVLNSREAGQEMEEAVPWDDFFSSPDSTVPRDRFEFFGLGSGVIVRREGDTYYVVTNYHVVGDSDQIRVTLNDERSFDARPVGVDSRKDLALVAFDSADELPVARLGSSASLYVGDWVLAIGNPLGYESSVTAGIISALGREEGPDDNISDFIQTDASINQGNSGGALVNMEGELIGINTWISTSTGGSMGLGFALPIDNVTSSVDDLIAYGKPRYGWLGVSMGDYSGPMKEAIEVPADARGAFIYQVFMGSPAWKGGLKPGDYVISLNGKSLKNRKELTYLIGEVDPGETVAMEVYRNGVVRTLEIRLEVRDEEDQVQSQNRYAWPGVLILPLNDTVRSALNLDETLTGVIIEDSYAKTAFQRAGVQPGDIIAGINGTAIESMNEFYEQIGDLSQNVFTLTVQRLTENGLQELEIIISREDINV